MASEPDQPSGPITPSRLTEIATKACDSTFASITSYSHSQTLSWNTSIINKVRQSVIAASSTDKQPSLYRFVVSSTIIQHTTPAPPLLDSDRPLSAAPPRPAGSAQDAGGDLPSPPASPRPEIVRPGMQSAVGASWDNETDGMWSFKYENGEAKDFDVVISVVWILGSRDLRGVGGVAGGKEDG